MQFCGKDDADSLSSLALAIQSFDDAFLALKIVEDSTLYQGAEQTYPHNEKFRVKNLPKDSYHIAFKAHRIRLKNILRFPGIDPIEKALLKQRFSNLATGQKGYIYKQNKALGDAFYFGEVELFYSTERTRLLQYSLLSKFYIYHFSLQKLCLFLKLDDWYPLYPLPE